MEQVQEQEIELKLRVMDEGCWSELCEFIMQEKDFVRCDVLRLAATYFDTEDSALKNARLTYRVRNENGSWVATIKGGGSSGGGLHQRHEWNVAVNNGEPDLRVFRGTTAEALVAGFFGLSLHPVVQTEFCRKAVMLEIGSDVIEVALDQGKVSGGRREAPILEVELELKRGKALALLELGMNLVLCFPLVLERKSKYFRGLILAGKVNAAKPEASCEDETMRAIYRLLAFIYDVWANDHTIDRVAYKEEVKRLRRAVPEELLGWSSELWLEEIKQGNSQGARSAVAGLLRCWKYVMMRLQRQ